MKRYYGQVYEDKVLLSALGHVDRGFYIDVGAQQPEYHSVTKVFYDRGWNGINVEPVSRWFDQLARERPRDINLRLVVGEARGETVLFEIPESGLSTVFPALAERHRKAGWAHQSQLVEMRPLSEICKEYVRGDIHFLKVDAVSEPLIFSGCDFSAYRPWIILFEATEPMTNIPTYHRSEAILLAAGYEFVAADTLNRYYVARERISLRDRLAPAVRSAARRDNLRRMLARVLPRSLVNRSIESDSIHFRSQPRIDRFALQREDAENTLVHAPQGFQSHKAL
jgi:FkbM family methyltransferase